MSGLISKNDPHSYLSGIFKNVSKGQEAAEKRVSVNSHSRSMPKRGSAGGSTGAQAPDGQPNPAMVSAAAHHMSNEKAPGAATVASRKMSGAKASSATHEAGESAAYEKMEEKTLKGLKGSKEKVLSEGHNTKSKNWIAGAIKKPGALHKQLGVPQGEKIPAKKMAAARSGKMGGTAQKRANLAKTLAGFKKK